MIAANGSRVILTSDFDRLMFGTPFEQNNFGLTGTTLSGQALIVVGLVDSDSGTYGCLAVSTLGNDSRNIELVVRG